MVECRQKCFNRGRPFLRDAWAFKQPSRQIFMQNPSKTYICNIIQSKYYFWKSKFYKCKESIKFNTKSYK